MMKLITMTSHITSFIDRTIDREELLQFLIFQLIRVEAFELDTIFLRFNISIILLLLVDCSTNMRSPNQNKYK